MESHCHAFTRGASLLHHHVGDSLGDLSLLLGGPAGKHRDLNDGHKKRRALKMGASASVFRPQVLQVRTTFTDAWRLAPLLRQLIPRKKETQLKARSIIGIRA